MRVLHLFSNARKFLRNSPFFNYVFRTEGIETEISDFMIAGETYPQVSVPVPMRLSFSPDDIKSHIEKFKPSILHCHHRSLLESAVDLGSFYEIPVFYSIYRHTLKDLRDNLDSALPAIEKLTTVTAYSPGIRDWLIRLAIKPPVTVLSEVLDTSYNFRESLIDESKKKPLTFAVLISELNPDYISNVHIGLEKILMTGNELKVAWVCFDERISRYLSGDITKRALGKHVSITELQNFPLLNYEGLITDGNQKRYYSDEHYVHIVLSCIKEGKLLVTAPEPGLDDLLLNGETCLVVPDYSSNKLSHLIHFFISFPEEIVNVTKSAREFYEKNHSFPVNSRRLLEAYSKAGNL